MKKNNRIIIIDTSAIIYSSFYTFGVLSHNGDATGIIFGVFKKLLAIAEKFETNRFFFAWDHKVNFRKELFSQYKENREIKRQSYTQKEIDEFISKTEQEFKLRNEILPEFGFKNHLYQLGYEADDFLALLSEKFKSEEVFILTNDADLYQCLDHCSIINPSTMKVMSKELFIEKYKCLPSQWSLCKSIGGCEGDNVIGIEGISDPKTGTSKSVKYVTGSLKSGKIYERIVSKEGQKIIKRNLPLVTLPFQKEGINPFLTRLDSFSKKKMIKIFSQYNFNSFLKSDMLKRFEKSFLS